MHTKSEYDLLSDLEDMACLVTQNLPILGNVRKINRASQLVDYCRERLRQLTPAKKETHEAQN